MAGDKISRVAAIKMVRCGLIKAQRSHDPGLIALSLKAGEK